MLCNKQKKKQCVVLICILTMFLSASTAYGANGSLKVTSFPANAQVSIDGVSTGKSTPMSISLSEGEHEVTVHISGGGWYPDMQMVTITRGNNDLSVTLLPAITEGDKGDKGDTGPAGPQGPKGDKGDKGDTGATGSQGDKGDTGDAGPKGDKGDTGATGLKGDKGDTGATGSQGDKGDTGDTGLKGDKGDTGDAGPKGDKGDTGATGSQGDKGDTGDAGPKGDKGDTGATGLKGDKGDTGATGSQGDKGDTGATGSQGDKGDTGDAGPKGDKGDTGDTGPKGDKGDTGDAGLKGDKGDTGDTGLKGDKGDTGDTGSRGPQGVPGPSGADGAPGTGGAVEDGECVPEAIRAPGTHGFLTISLDMEGIPEPTEWYKICGGIISIEYPTGTTGTDQYQNLSNAMGDISEIVLSDPLVPGSKGSPTTFTSYFSVDLYDGLGGSGSGYGATSVSITPLIFPPIPFSDGRFSFWKMYQPGQQQYVTMTITANVPLGYDNISEWVKDFLEGNEVRKDVTVTGFDQADETSVEYSFRDCIPTSFQSLPGSEKLTLMCTVSSIDTGNSFDIWINEMLQGQDQFKSISIVYLNPDGTELYRNDYMSSFLSGYIYPQFNAFEDDVRVEHTIKIKAMELLSF